jgi:hypothetical protein
MVGVRDISAHVIVSALRLIGIIKKSDRSVIIAQGIANPPDLPDATGGPR